MVVRYDLRRSLAPAFVLINFVGGRLLEIPILMQRFVVDPLCNTADISRHTKYIKIDCTQSFCYNLFFISTYTNDPDRINTRNIGDLTPSQPLRGSLSLLRRTISRKTSGTRVPLVSQGFIHILRK